MKTIDRFDRICLLLVLIFVCIAIGISIHACAPELFVAWNQEGVMNMLSKILKVVLFILFSVLLCSFVVFLIAILWKALLGVFR